jgi:hypothetical protein
MAELDNELLEAFIDGFYGYGNLKAHYWFIGMEEGGGDSLKDVQRRLAVWREHGENVTEDLVNYHTAIGVTKFFKPQPKLQRTWSKLIRVLHILEGKPTLNKLLKHTQREHFGRSGSVATSCLLELLPLPSPSVGHWFYSEYSSLPYLKDRETYRKKVIPKRIELIRKKIQKHKPHAVLFYGTGYLNHWQGVSKLDFAAEAIGKYDALFGCNEDTLFVVTGHPASWGIRNDYFDRVGELMRERIR